MTERRTPRQDRRRKAIVETAQTAFLRDGYGATTMSAIAAELGGSKTTLWSYFPCKQDLFVAVVDEMIERYGDALRLDLAADLPLAEGLTLYGTTVMCTITRPQIVALHRMIAAEAGRTPQLGRILWKRGGARGQQLGADWLAEKMARGEMRQADPLAAARQFIGLCQADSFFRHLIGAASRPTAKTISAEVAESVALFTAAYAV